LSRTAAGPTRRAGPVVGVIIIIVAFVAFVAH
jgi:hypothetical protein